MAAGLEVNPGERACSQPLARSKNCNRKNLYKRFDLYTYESMLKKCCTEINLCTGIDSRCPCLPFPAKPKIAISACLMGAEVRYNGGHKESRLCSRTLAEYFDFSPVCPEVAIGMGIPREPIRLVGDPDHPEAIGTVNPAINVTRPLAEYGEQMAAELNDICGYIFMQQSPSCGLERVKVYHANGAPVNGGGRGIYAQAFCARHPDLPVEEAGRLNDPVLRENFITRVFAYSAWQQLLAQGLSRRRLTEFHSRYKYLLMAHNPLQYKTLGKLLGNMAHSDPGELGPRYFSELMAGAEKMRHARHP